MMLLEGNGFIKVLTPMKATVWSPVSIHHCILKMCFYYELTFLSSIKLCFSELNSARQLKWASQNMINLTCRISLGPLNEGEVGNVT